MKLRDVSRKEIIKMALEALPDSNEGHVIVVVDVRNGNVEVLSKTHQFEDWAANSFDFKKALFSLNEEDIAANDDVESLYRKYKFEICCTILEIKEKHPHLA